MSGQPFRLSRETLASIKQDPSLLRPIAGLYKQTQLRLSVADPEAKTQRTVKDNGDVEISFVYPVDNNTAPEDGRLYLQDSFLFDASEENLKDFKREVSYNQKGEATQWMDWLSQYQAAEPPSKDQAIAFAQTTGKSYSRELSADLIRALGTQKEVLLDALASTRVENAKWRLKLKDDQSHYNVVFGKENIEVTLAIVMDDDEDPANGRIFLKDKFILDAKTQAFKEFSRTWEVAPESKGNEKLEAAVARLNEGELSFTEGNQAYLKALMPVVLPLSDDSFRKLMNALTVGVSEIGSVSSPAATLDKRQVVNLEGLEIIGNVGLELMGRRYDEEQGWMDKAGRLFTRKKGFDPQQGTALWKSITEKAAARIQEKKGADKSVFSVLMALDLNGEEKALRDWLISQAPLQQINAIEKDLDDEMRHDNLLYLAREKLWKKEGLYESATVLAKFLEKSPVSSVQGGAKELLSFAEGEAGVGTKLEYTLPMLAKEVAKPSMLFGMMGAGVVGVGVEAMALNRIGKLGTLGRMAAGGVGILGEAASFTALHKLWESASTNVGKVWQGYFKEVGSASTLFMAMRLAHFSSGIFTTKMAEGKILPRFSRPITTSSVPHFMTAPSGRIISTPVMRELTRGGKLLSALANHGGGIGAMWGVGYLNRFLKLHDGSQNNHRGNFADALLMYTQAMVGFNLANRLTGGHLQTALAGSRIRLEQMKLEAAPPSGPATVPEISSNAKLWLMRLFAKEFRQIEARIKSLDAEREVSRQTILEKDAEIARLEGELVEERVKARGDEVTKPSATLGDLTPTEDPLQAARRHADEEEGARRKVEGELTTATDRIARLEADLAKAQAEKAAAEQKAAANQKEVERLRTQSSHPDITPIDEEGLPTALRPPPVPREVADPLFAEAERAVLEGANARAEATIAELRGQIARLEAQKQSLEERSAQTDPTAGELAQVKSDLENAQRRADELQTQLDLKNLEGRPSPPPVQAELEAARAEGESIRLEKEQVEADLVEVHKEVERLRGEYEALKAKKEEVEGKASQKEFELGEAIRAKSAELTSLREAKASIERSLASAEAQARQVPGLEAQIVERDASIRALSEKLESALERAGQAQKRVRDLESNLEIKSAELEEQKEEVDRLNRGIEAAQAEKASAESAAARAKTAYEQALENQSAEAQDLHQKWQAELLRANGAEAREKDLQNQLAGKQRDFEISQAELDQAQADLQKAVAAKDKAQTDAAQREAGFSREIEKQKTKIQELEADLSDKKTKLANAEQAVRDLRRSLGEKENQAQALQEELEVERGKVRLSQAKVESLSAQLKEANANLTQASQGYQTMERQAKTVQAELQRAEDRVAKAEERFKKTILSKNTNIERLKKNLEVEKEAARLARERLHAIEEELRIKQRLIEEWRGRVEEHKGQVAKAKAEKAEVEAAANQGIKKLNALMDAKETEARGLLQKLEADGRKIMALERLVRLRNIALEKKEQEFEWIKRHFDAETQRGNEAETARSVLQLAYENQSTEFLETKQALKGALQRAETAETTVRRLERDLTGSLQLVERLKANVDHWRKAYETAKEEKDSVVADAARKRAELEVQLQEKTAQSARLQTELATEMERADFNAKRVEGLSKTAAALEGEVKRLTGRIQEEGQRATEAVAKALELDDLVRRFERELGKQLTNIQKLNGDLETAREERVQADLEAKVRLEAVETQLKQTGAELAKEKAEVVRLSGELEKAQQEKRDAEIAHEQEVIALTAELGGKEADLEAKQAELRAEKAAVVAARTAKAESDAGFGRRIAGLEAELSKAVAAGEKQETKIQKLGVAIRTLVEVRDRADEAHAEKVSELEKKILDQEAGLMEAKEEIKDLKFQLLRAREEWDNANRVAKNKVVFYESQLTQKERLVTEARRNAAASRLYMEEAQRELGRRGQFSQARITDLMGQLEEVRAEAERLREALSKETEDKEEAMGDAAIAGGQLEEKDAEISRLTEDLRIERERAAELERARDDLERNLGGVSERNVALEGERVELESHLTAARKEIEDLKSEAAEAKAEAETAKDQMEEHSKELRTLRGDREELQRDLQEAKAKSARLDGELIRAKAELEALKGRMTTLETRIKDRETELRNKGDVASELVALKEEEVRLKGELTTAQETVARLETQLRGVQGDAQTRAGTLAGLTQRITELSAEGAAWKARVEAAEGRAAEAEGRLAIAQSHLAKQETEYQAELVRIRAEAQQGIRPLDLKEVFFNGVDPRTEWVETSVQETRSLKDALGQEIGEAFICAGNQNGEAAMVMGDLSLISAKTSRGGRRYQEDAVYTSHYLLPDGSSVVILAGADGAGGEGGGDVASSAFLQGIHARVAEMAAQGRVPTAEELFSNGVRAVETRKNQADREKLEKATGAGAVVVIFNNEAQIASAGDAIVVFARKAPSGRHETRGYTHVDNYNNNTILNGIHQDSPNLYEQKGLRPGDRFAIGSDGFYENVLGADYKQQGSREIRKREHTDSPDQNLFHNLNVLFEITANHEGAAQYFHDIALSNITQPGQKLTWERLEIQLPEKRDKDNIFAINYQHGSDGKARVQRLPLEPVPFEASQAGFRLPAELIPSADLHRAATTREIPSPPPAAAPHAYKNVGREQIAPFALRYRGALATLYGDEAFTFAGLFTQLHHNIRGLETFNPEELAKAQDRAAQEKLFSDAERFLKTKDQDSVPPEIIAGALEDLKAIQGAQRPLRMPGKEDTVLLSMKYQRTLAEMFGPEAEKVGEFLASLYKNLPEIEAKFNPDLWRAKFDPAHYPGEQAGQLEAEMQAYFEREIGASLHPEAQKHNEVGIYRHASTLAHQIFEILKMAREHRLTPLWGGKPRPEPLFRNWFIPEGNSFQAGRKIFNGNQVSSEHFLISQGEKGDRWYLLDTQSTNGTWVNGKRLEPGRKYYLEDGDFIQFGERFGLNFNLFPGKAVLTERYSFRFAQSFTLGRDKSCEARVYDTGVSEKQLQFANNNQGWFVRNIDPTNVSYLNGKMLPPHDWKPLTEADTLQVGKTILQFSTTADGEAHFNQVLVPPEETGVPSTAPVPQGFGPDLSGPPAVGMVNPPSFQKGILTMGDASLIRIVGERVDRVQLMSSPLEGATAFKIVIPRTPSLLDKVLKSSNEFLAIQRVGANHFILRGLRETGQMMVSYPDGDLKPIREGTELPLKGGEKIMISGHEFIFQP